MLSSGCQALPIKSFSTIAHRLSNTVKMIYEAPRFRFPNERSRGSASEIPSFAVSPHREWTGGRVRLIDIGLAGGSHSSNSQPTIDFRCDESQIGGSGRGKDQVKLLFRLVGTRAAGSGGDGRYGNRRRPSSTWSILANGSDRVYAQRRDADHQ